MKPSDYLKFASSEDDRLFLSKIADVSALCEKRNTACFTSFLDEHQKQLLILAAPYLNQGAAVFYGGYESAQRCIAAFLPEYLDKLLPEEFPLQALRFQLKRPHGEAPSHRDYLGTILSLGIKRETIGDLLVDETGCIAFAEQNVADYLIGQIQKVKNQGVVLSCWDGPVEKPEQALEEVGGSVSSVRLDSVLALCRRISREKAQKVIAEGRVQVNFMPVRSPDIRLSKGDVLSVKGYGRSVLSEIGRGTKKGRIFITVNNLR